MAHCKNQVKTLSTTLVNIRVGSTVDVQGCQSQGLLTYANHCLRVHSIILTAISNSSTRTLVYLEVCSFKINLSVCMEGHSNDTSFSRSRWQLWEVLPHQQLTTGTKLQCGEQVDLFTNFTDVFINIKTSFTMQIILRHLLQNGAFDQHLLS